MPYHANSGSFKIGNHPPTQFKKGLIPWCKGTKGLVKAWNKGNIKYKIITYEWLYQKYIIEQLSPEQIRKIVGCSYSVINDALTKYCIPKRSVKEGDSIATKRKFPALVLRPLSEVHDEDLGRLSFKVINPEFLLKYGE
jgi:hypothetical protein